MQFGGDKLVAYDLIRSLTDYPADAEIHFDIGNFSGNDCSFTLKEYFYSGENHFELHIIPQ